MSEKREMSELERRFYHLRKDDERYLPGEAIGVRDEDIKARKDRAAMEPRTSTPHPLRRFASSILNLTQR